MLFYNYNKTTKTLTLLYNFDKDISYLLKELEDIIEEIEIINFSKRISKWSSFNNPIDNLPKKLTHLTFGYCFNLSVDYLPETLTHLTFGYKFNKSVDYLPETLTHLTFGYSFNQSVDNLPKNLIHLTFGACFNHSVDYLPKKLKYLYFSFKSEFNKSLNNLPKYLKILQINSNYNGDTKNPLNSKKIIISAFNYLINNLSPNVEKLTIIFKIKSFNRFIEYKVYGHDNYDNDIYSDFSISDSDSSSSSDVDRANYYCTDYEDYDHNEDYDKFHHKNGKYKIFINNLPTSIKEITIDDKLFKNHINIPFGATIKIDSDLFRNVV